MTPPTPPTPHVTLRLDRTQRNQRDNPRTADAYWIGGSDPTAWLEVIDGWPVDLSALRLVPTAHDGVLVLLPPGASVTIGAACANVAAAGGAVPTPQPYRRQDSAVFVPLDAELDPPLDAETLRALADVGTPYAQFIITPRGTPTAFDPDDTRTIADLWQRPGRAGDRWDHARPGTRLRSRLDHVEADHDRNPHDPRSIFEQLEPSWPNELPDEPGEKEPQSWGEWVRTRVADSALWFTRKLPRDTSPGDEPSRLESWAMRNSSLPKEERDGARLREIERLLHWLEHDPERGLRFAASLAAERARGVFTEGHQLAPNEVDFDLDRWRSTRPLAIWGDIPSDLREALRRRYLELAELELRAKRPRRAAYIHGHLLGDLSTAAATLLDGGYPEEAAVLYEEWLDDRSRAAESWLRAGNSERALELFRDLGRYEEGAKLCAELHRHEEAITLWRLAVDQYRDRRELAPAAELLRRSIAPLDPTAAPEARALLEREWRTAVDAERSLSLLFEFYRQEERETKAVALIDSLPNDPGPSRRGTLAVLGEITRGDESHTLRAAAEEACLRLIATVLGDDDATEREHAVETLASLRPDDTVLRRDVDRFRRLTASSPPSKQRADASIALPTAHWEQVLATPDGFLAAGWKDDLTAIATRGRVGSDPRTWRTHEWTGVRRAPLFVGHGDARGQRVMVGTGTGPRLEEHTFRPSNAFGSPLRVGVPTFVPRGTRAVTSRDGAPVTLSIHRDRWVLADHDHDGQLLSTRELPTPAPDLRASDVPVALLAAESEVTWVAVGSVLHRTEGADFMTTPLLDDARTLSVIPGARPRWVAIGLAQGGLVVRRQARNGARIDGREAEPMQVAPRTDDQYPIAEWLPEPHFHWLNDGSLLGVSRGQAARFDVSTGRPVEMERTSQPWREPIAVLPDRTGPSRVETAWVFDRRGGIHRWSARG